MTISNALARNNSRSPTLPDLMTVEEVKDFLRVSRATVDRWVLQKRLPPPVKLGRAVVRFSRDAVLAFLDASQSSEPHQARTPKASRPKATRTRRSK